MQNEDQRIDLTKTRSIFEWGDEIIKTILTAIYFIIHKIEQVLNEVY